jgi:hypothetical protein
MSRRHCRRRCVRSLPSRNNTMFYYRSVQFHCYHRKFFFVCYCFNIPVVVVFFVVVENVIVFVNSVLGSENTGSGQTSWPPLLKGAIWKQHLKETQVIFFIVCFYCVVKQLVNKFFFHLPSLHLIMKMKRCHYQQCLFELHQILLLMLPE